MDDLPTFDPLWWISMVELPALAGLFWMIWRARRDAGEEAAELRQRSDDGDARVRADLADFKLEVAREYASLASLKDVERRLVAHLLRIEDKLDRTGHPQGVGVAP
ncbi:MAG: hypothetical protein KDA49_17460 [Rhodospirillaceae bacterium]|nr:hypothetical protein [Rhodospirillaceae bacterium]MCA8934270.1 hypothetical protein [Rhodospirillaceae bacterium]